MVDYYLEDNSRLFILTGAGISAESGIPTFRDENGLWSRYDPERVATASALQKHPEEVYHFINEMTRLSKEVQPNAAHYALAELENKLGDRVLIVTQNVDDLHERAGSQNVIHIHGQLGWVRCRHHHIQHWEGPLRLDDRCPYIDDAGHPCGLPLRPHVVLFGEAILEHQRILDALLSCELFVAIGTSGVIQPASEFVTLAKAQGATTIEINLQATEGSLWPWHPRSRFDHQVLGPAAQTVPQWVHALLPIIH